MQKYAELFTPMKIGKMQLKNRIVMSPMTTRLGEAENRVSERMIDYYEARAKGGAAMITTEAIYVAARYAGSNTVALDTNQQIPALAAMADAVHAGGAKFCVQLGCGLGRYEGVGKDGNGPKTSSPISVFMKPDVPCTEMTVKEIAQVVKEYGSAARRAVRAGADAINIHGHNGYLIDQFMSAQFNQRTDEYGGSMENRMRYATDIVASVRAAVGANIPIIFRFSLDLCFKGARGMEESVEMLKILQNCGIDALDLDTGATESMEWIFIPYYKGEGCAVYVAKEARKAGITLPILNSGNHNPDTALAAIKSKDVDFVMFGRSLIADPELPNKLRQGKEKQVRPCMRCNEFCTKRSISTNAYVSCAGNAAAGNEVRFAIKTSNTKSEVAVIGAGPAGMESARVAALKGCAVTLYEKSGKLGGMANIFAGYSFRPQTDAFLAWQMHQLEILGVKIVLNKEIDASSPELANAEHIIVAVGGKTLPAAFDGVENALSIADFMGKALPTGKKVAIVGADLAGCEFAIEMAKAKNTVSLIEKQKKLGYDAYGINKPALSEKIKEAGVQCLTLATVKCAKNNALCLETEEGEKTIEAEMLFYSPLTAQRQEFVQTLEEAFPGKVLPAGNCVASGSLGAAVREGFFAANRI